MSETFRTYDESYPPSILTPAPPIVNSTGATAGIPGTWTPAGSTPPASVAALIAGTPNAVTASPATLWTVGQYVQTATAGAAGQAHWSSTAWVAGAAPIIVEDVEDDEDAAATLRPPSDQGGGGTGPPAEGAETVTVYDIPPPVDKDWRNDQLAASDALTILKLSPLGSDAERMLDLAAAAGDAICHHLDRLADNPIPGAAFQTPPPALRVAHANVTVELWRRKDAPFGILNAWSSDDVAVRIGNDPLRGVYHLINPYKSRWGIS